MNRKTRLELITSSLGLACVLLLFTIQIPIFSVIIEETYDFAYRWAGHPDYAVKERLFGIVKDYIQPSNDAIRLTPEQAATQIDDACPHHSDEENELRANIDAKETVNDLQVWQDLPGFVVSVHEELRTYGHGDLLSDEEEDKSRQDTWRKLHAFAQRLTNSGLGDFRFEGMAALRQTLEEPFLPDPDKASRQLEYLVALAASWIDSCGHSLIGWGWERNQGEPIATIGQSSIGLPIPAWEMPAGVLFFGGGSGLSKRRWDFWKRRFHEIKCGTGELSFLNEMVKSMAGHAYTRMDEIEKESQSFPANSTE